MNESPSANPVLVVGGGIGGLTTALALSRKGIPVRVLEQAAEFRKSAPAFNSAQMSSACSSFWA